MYPYIDLHCDTLSKILKLNSPGTLEENPGFHVDLKRLREGGAMAQVFAIWMQEGDSEWSDWTYIEKLTKIFQDALSDTFRHALTVEDLKKNREEGVLSGVLSLEDCRVVESLDDLETLYSMGIRSYGFIWNHENSIAYPNSTDRDVMNRGLKPLGKEAVEWLNEKGGLIDVSHLSDGGFWDVAELSKKPFVATHSNARALTDHQRNLTDEMLKALAEKGGVTGLNFCTKFIRIHREDNQLEDYVRHLNHMKKVAGEDVVALGSDFDGITGELAISTPTEMHLLFDALEKDGWSHRQIEKLAGGNVLRVLGDVW